MNQGDGESGWTRGEFVRNVGLGLGAAAVTSVGALARQMVSTGSDDDFEYIIVGSGAGGGPLASRLAEAGKSVLLLEAGGLARSSTAEVPAFHPQTSEDPAIAWNFYVEHYANALQRDLDPKRVRDRGVLYPRAATVGGCTEHNALVTLYPDNRDWDGIAAATGDESWNAQAMRGYFQKLEQCRYVTPATRLARGQHGDQGWLSTEQTDARLLLSDERLSALAYAALSTAGLGAELIEKILLQKGNLEFDPNGAPYVSHKRDGVFNVPRATLRGRRTGVREFILNTMRAHPGNLRLKTECLVTSLVFHPDDATRVIGVEYLEGARTYRADPNASAATAARAVRRMAKATREVILCGGAFNTPQLLMLAGIGRAEELERVGVASRIDRRGVGRNLQDRYEVTVVTELNDELRGLRSCTFGNPNDPCLETFATDPEASIYSSNGVVLSVIRRSKASEPDPDLVVFGVPGMFKGYYPGYSRDALSKRHFTWAVLKGHTRNTAGYVQLKSNDPLDTPHINFKYFDESNDARHDDLRAVVDGVKYARRMNSHLASRFVTRGESFPGSSVRDDEDISKFVRDHAWGHHASCSNKMGPVSDPMAVVDSRFRVHGVKNLRVVDASVFPKIPGLFIAVPIYMAAEKAAEDILFGRS